MKVELTIDRTKELPEGAVPALERELLKRLQSQFDECSLIVRRAGSDGLSVYGGEKEAKKKVEEILQETWESADEWFYKDSMQ
ncbi:TPA: DinI-like family protein [Enterobacter ludwigii]|nr:DinI-like family protein [Enterobacter ludwigii]